MYKIGNDGIMVGLYEGTKEVEVGKGGKVGILHAGVSYLLAVVVPRVLRIWVLAVDGKKTPVLRQGEFDPDIEVDRYDTSIHIWETGNGIAYTRYPENHVRFVEYMGDGKARLVEVALISQNGVFWLTAQKTYDIAVGRTADGEFLCPQFAEKWPAFVSLLADLLAEETLPVEVPALPPLSAKVDLQRGVGQVEWWNCAQQMGAIRTPKGSAHPLARVHWTQVIGSNGDLCRLTPGQLVSFEGLQRPRTAPGDRPTGFKLEATNVRLI